MGIFDTKKDDKTEIFNRKSENTNILVSTRYGREITTAENAKKELYFKPKRANPLDYINQNGTAFFYGMKHEKGTNEAVYLPADDITMQLLIGSTRNGEGCIAPKFLS